MKNTIAENINTLELSIPNIVMRFYLMMGIVIGFGFAGQMLVGTIIAFGLAFSTIIGLSYKAKEATQKQVVEKRDVKAKFIKREQTGQFQMAN